MASIFNDDTKKTDLRNYLLNSPLYGEKKPDVEKVIDLATTGCVNLFNDYTKRNIDKKFKQYRWEDRCSDERQYCAPGVDLPIATIMKSKPGSYPEYHTSLDNLKNVVTPKGLSEGFNALQKIIEALNENFYPVTNIICEPFLSKRNLYPTINDKVGSKIDNLSRLIIDTLSWCDGNHDIIDIAEKIRVPVWKLYPIISILKKSKLIKNYNSFSI